MQTSNFPFAVHRIRTFVWLSLNNSCSRSLTNVSRSALLAKAPILSIGDCVTFVLNRQLQRNSIQICIFRISPGQSRWAELKSLMLTAKTKDSGECAFFFYVPCVLGSTETWYISVFFFNWKHTPVPISIQMLIIFNEKKINLR